MARIQTTQIAQVLLKSPTLESQVLLELNRVPEGQFRYLGLERRPNIQWQAYGLKTTAGISIVHIHPS